MTWLHFWSLVIFQRHKYTYFYFPVHTYTCMYLFTKTWWPETTLCRATSYGIPILLWRRQSEYLPEKKLTLLFTGLMVCGWEHCFITIMFSVISFHCGELGSREIFVGELVQGEESPVTPGTHFFHSRQGKYRDPHPGHVQGVRDLEILSPV